MIALDTNLFIYVLEANPEFAKRAVAVLHSTQGVGVASTLVYAEMLSAPVFADAAPRRTVLSFLDMQNLRYIEVTREVLVRAAELRATSDRRLGLGDAIHLASALQAGADTFVTNDKDLLKVKVPGLAIKSL